MVENVSITVKNLLNMDMKYLNVVHCSTVSAHLLSSNRAIELPLGNTDIHDHIHISACSEGGNDMWKDCLIDMPFWVDFELAFDGKATLLHSGNRLHLKLPSAPPTWQLKIRRPVGNGIACSNDYVVIADK